MRKTITYSTFILASFVVAVLFLTAKDYVQLALAAILYPVVAYLYLNLFPRKTNRAYKVAIVSEVQEANEISKDEQKAEEVTPVNKEKVDIADIDKREFLKLIGATGISIFLLSLFSKKAQLPFFGKMGSSDNLVIKDTEGLAIDPAERQPFDGYQISEIDDSVVAYYGFINKSGAWFIMKEDTETSSFRYAKGSEGFPQSWNNRTRLKYDYFYNV